MTADPSIDPRLAAFLREDAPEAFHAIAQRGQLWRYDPYDVDSIHADARALFDELVERARGDDRSDTGRVLVALGEAGSGKTHLLRALRRRVHAARAGFVAYAQMTSFASNYLRYLLGSTLDSLGWPYDEQTSLESGLLRLSDRLVELPGAASDDELRVLREEDDEGRLRRMVWRVGNRIVNKCFDDVAAREVDADVVFQLLFLQRRLPLLQNGVVRFLRCETLGARETELFGGIASRTSEEDPMRMLQSLGRLVGVLDGGAFVLCIDQLEDAWAEDDTARERFRRTLLAVRELADRVPNAVVVLACDENYYNIARQQLERSLLDRLESDPPPVTLGAKLPAEQAVELIAARVAAILEHAGVQPDPDDPVYPFDRGEIAAFASDRIRDLIQRCGNARRAAIRSGERPRLSAAGFDAPPAPQRRASSTGIDLDRAWSDFLSAYPETVPESEEELAGLLGASLAGIAPELTTGHVLRPRVSGSRVELRIEGADGAVVPRELCIGVCDKTPRGGHLQRQVTALLNKADGRTPAIVRSTDFPSDPKTEIARLLGGIVAEGGRRVVCPTTEWIAMLAMRDFAARHGGDPRFLEWRRSEQPLLMRPVFVELLRPDDLLRRPAGVEAPEPTSDRRATRPAATQHRAPPAQVEGPIVIGTSRTLDGPAVTLDPLELGRHAAFLGGTGSGKTSLAMAILEQAAERGIAVLMIDRKGDLATWADPDAWGAAQEDATDPGRVRALHDRLDVQLFTPGDPSGQSLFVPVLPAGGRRLLPAERDDVVRHYAAALAGMIDGGQGRRGSGQQRLLAILQSGLATLDEIGEADQGLPRLIDLLHGQDPRLVQRLGAIEPRHLPKVAETLQALWINEKPILSGESGGEPLDVERLLAVDERFGQTRVAVISTVALGDPERVQFLVTHVLVDLARLAARRPSEDLKALLFLDEADLYLPATRQPSTKEPLMHALRRFRSAGIGVLLATQNPGDLDYKARDNVRSWFVGRVQQTTALKKLEPLMGVRRAHVREALPRQSIGQFHLLQEGRVEAFAGRRPVLEPRQLNAERIAELARRGPWRVEDRDAGS